ncbi:MAG TPA: hypothetical protein VGN69_02445 [Solirubrobacteraceae bacterium]|jgi:hypothetical protein|nr:hypothetical protein [Solirubrobacteraceae bacterium]
MSRRRPQPPTQSKHDALEARLQGLTWPGAADDVKQRCLKAILNRVSLEGSATGPRSAHRGGALRLELTRRDRPSARSPLATPSLQPRFACRL